MSGEGAPRFCCNGGQVNSDPFKSCLEDPIGVDHHLSETGAAELITDGLGGLNL